ncbi:MAG: outer membrane lipoprotein-sorting protein [Myxococcales bacterium]|nr:outer membrane lipoprotein-sorting protein [Myxococcales bacterium]MDD9971482.1 outer membrane lipoprotein-sorting protein [Myxococcales bacterium]
MDRRTLQHATLVTLAFGGVTIGHASLAAAVEPSETDPRKIAKAAEDRPDGDKGISRVSLTLVDASGRKRVRKTVQRSLDFPDGTKTLIFFESPADVRNTGLLSVDYDAGEKDDDQWLYLPSLHKATRISSADKSGSFMGTDLTYADMTSRDTDVYDYKMLEQSVKVDGEDCWLIESRPKTDKERKETGYLKTHVWISKNKLMPLQMKAWVIEGKKIKLIKFSSIAKIDGIWVAKKLAVQTRRNNKVESSTLMEISDIKFNQGSVTDELFSQRRLEQGL